MKSAVSTPILKDEVSRPAPRVVQLRTSSMKRNASRDNRVSRRCVLAGNVRGNVSAEGLAVTAILGGALVFGLLVLREQRRFAPVIQIDRASLNSTTVQWVAAGIVCAFALGCAYAALRHLPIGYDHLLPEAVAPPEELANAFDLLGDPDTELGRMFGAGLHFVGQQAEAPAASHDAAGLVANEGLFRALVQNSADGIIIAAPDTTIRFLSAPVEKRFGYRGGDLVGRRLSNFVHRDDRRSVHRTWMQQATTPRGTTFTVRCRVKDAGARWRTVEVAGVNMIDDAAVGGIVLHVRDITERTANEELLTHRAFHDPLTALANRALFRDRVGHALARSRREKTPGVVVLFLDLDDFKTVNDTMGHEAGDQVLVASAAKLLNATRGSDTVARLGGDEFAILLENTRVDEEALVVARRLLTSLSMPVSVDARELRELVRVGASIGIVRARADDTEDTLLRNADLAMYKAKKGGKNRFEIFHPDMQAEVAERVRLESDMRGSLVAGTDFQLAYQPIVDLWSRAIVGVESLARWDHPHRGMLAPAAFMALAEESGLIVPLGRWILREACRQLSRWHASAETPSLGMTINVSARQLRDASLLHDVEDALGDFGIDPAALTLDITESVIMSDTDSTLNALFELKGLGVRIAIDDVGTGYSSLSYLRQFPIDVLKIDKSFVDGVAKGGQHSALARTVIALADTLGLQAIAEGIEHANQLEALAKLGCQFGQGFLFAKPLPADQIAQIIETGNANIAAGAKVLVNQ